MNIPTDVQIITHSGKPAFAVVPYDQWLQLTGQNNEVYFPHEVVGFQLKGHSLIAAWRKHKKLSQEQLADRLGISQSAMAQIEKSDSKPQTKTLERVANALGISTLQLKE
ncbi:helix-turn-helix domain-containing protein [Endozoicomonas gorgoniicola]|uniref:Helix-turn-helix domain-containing protein n=1 Tax=Endozoicomonas gorgoniicola TaxID=1234144 RepID=A0ABT3N232_9GAMM|nr:helix-turn-helix transcriptional regulator [Endozoicomonas gorgoniicola]MCW7555254.1 helix-turn-helix domain-containing protein [Endozoicomonas gorgoniicola]